VDDWRAMLPWVRDGLVLFEDMGWGEIQDELRRDGFHVLGGSAIGDRLEQDREFGQRALRDAGMHTAPARTFDSFADATQFIRAQPGRYVLKFNGSEFPSNMNYVGQRSDGADVVAILARHARTWDEDWDEPPSFILMEHLAGIETGFGAFFD